ncbi:hypothetical protein LTR56_024138, partial [Elasticomyces elasticus]
PNVPPPFSYAGLPNAAANCSYSEATTYCSLPTTGVDVTLCHGYPPPAEQAYGMPGPYVKQEPAFNFDDDQSPFAASYAAISGMDVSTANRYRSYVSNRPQQPAFHHTIAGLIRSLTDWLTTPL